MAEVVVPVDTTPVGAANTTCGPAIRMDLDVLLSGLSSAVFVVGAAGQVGVVRSAVCEAWWGPVGGRTAAAWLAQGDAEAEAWLEMGFEDVFGGRVPLRLALSQLPRSLRTGARDVALTYLPQGAGRVPDSVLVMAEDVSADQALRAAEGRERELVKVLDRVAEDRAGFVSFLQEASKLVAAATDPTASREVVFRAMHTLKGITALYGLHTVSAVAHQLETRLMHEGESGGEHRLVLDEAAREALQDAWQAMRSRLGRLTGVDRSNLIEVPFSEVFGVLEALAEERPHAEIGARIAGWRFADVGELLHRLGREAPALAKQLGRCPVQVQVQGGGLGLDEAEWSGFFAAAVHLVRNAVAHGLEGVEARAASGKPATATLTLSAHVQGDALCVSVQDDGKGICWDKVATKAADAGLPHASRADLVQALFADGLSTQAAADHVSGRGVGLAALRAEVQQRGGRLEVHSEPGQGARFTMRFDDAPFFVWTPRQ